MRGEQGGECESTCLATSDASGAKGKGRFKEGSAVQSSCLNTKNIVFVLHHFSCLDFRRQ